MVKRLLLAVPTLLAVVTVVFLTVRTLPGDPALAVLGDQASKEALAAFRANFGLDRPLVVQYADFLGRLVKGDLGRSILTGRPIGPDLVQVLGFTLELTAAGVLLGAFAGLVVGAASAVYRRSWVDYLSRAVSLSGLSVPAFYLGILLILLFALKLGWFPVISAGTGGPGERLRGLVLPALSIGAIMAAYVTRMTRSSMLEVLREDYVRTARAKGLPDRSVLFRHVLKNALVPVVTVVGMYTAELLGSSVMTEIVFNRPGLGKLVVGAIKQRDYAMLESAVMVYGALVVAVNLATDLLYGVIDPRVRYE